MEWVFKQPNCGFTFTFKAFRDLPGMSGKILGRASPKNITFYCSSPWKAMKGHRDVKGVCENAWESERECVMSVRGGGWFHSGVGRRQVPVTGSDSRYHWLQTSPSHHSRTTAPNCTKTLKFLKGLFHTLHLCFFPPPKLIIQRLWGNFGPPMSRHNLAND